MVRCPFTGKSYPVSAPKLDEFPEMPDTQPVQLEIEEPDLHPEFNDVSSYDLNSQFFVPDDPV
jgi:hypothetical protein